jgi:hypothetical protein
VVVKGERIGRSSSLILSISQLRGGVYSNTAQWYALSLSSSRAPVGEKHLLDRRQYIPHSRWSVASDLALLFLP